MVLPYIDMNQPWVYMCPPSWNPPNSLAIPSLRAVPVHQPWVPVSCIEPILEIYFTYGDIHQFSSVAQSCPTLCNPMDCSMSGLLDHHQLPEFTQTHVHWVGDAFQPPHSLSSPCPPAFNLSQHQGLSNESALRIRWPKCWSFSFNSSPANKYSGLISFRMD